jgi:hypothetical protein
MGEMDHDLDRPLGCDQEEDRAALRWRIRPRRAAVAIVALAFTAVAALFLLAPRRPLDATLGGRSYALSKIEPYAPPPPKPAAKPAEAAKAPDAPAGSSVQLRSVDEHARATSEIEVQNGVRILRAGGGGGANPLIIEVEPATRLAPASDTRLVEQGRIGPLPRLGRTARDP